MHAASWPAAYSPRSTTRRRGRSGPAPRSSISASTGVRHGSRGSVVGCRAGVRAQDRPTAVARVHGDAPARGGAALPEDGEQTFPRRRIAVPPVKVAVQPVRAHCQQRARRGHHRGLDGLLRAVLARGEGTPVVPRHPAAGAAAPRAGAAERLEQRFPAQSRVRLAGGELEVGRVCADVGPAFVRSRGC